MGGWGGGWGVGREVGCGRWGGGGGGFGRECHYENGNTTRLNTAIFPLMNVRSLTSHRLSAKKLALYFV